MTGKTPNEQNLKQWEKRSKLFGASLKSVLFKSMPNVVNEHLHNWQKRIILRYIENRNNIRILDVGCGYGRLSIPLIKVHPHANIIGMDISENYVKLYERNTDRSTFVGRVETIPAKLNEFDYIICVTVLMYLRNEDLRKGIRNLLEHLKPRGKLILIENDQSCLPFQTGFGLVKLLRKNGDIDSIDTGGRCFKRNEIRELVAKEGGRILLERRLPVTTICILPMCLIGKIFPVKLSRLFFKRILILDRVWGKLKLPSIYVASVVEKQVKNIA